MVQGLIVKVLNQWFQVATSEGVVPCRPRGRLQLARSPRTLLVGDRVRISLQTDGTGAIEAVLPRRAELLRPPVANVDQVLLVFTWVEPSFNPDFLDRVLVLAGKAGHSILLVLNKLDLLTDGEQAEASSRLQVYRDAGYPCFLTSALTGEGAADLRPHLRDRITVVAGQSGVGKSCLLNALGPGLALKTGSLSAKAGRGRHTTRHVELLSLGEGWVADAPGFSRLDVTALAPGELAGGFPEIAGQADGCRFRGCLHQKEPDCAVRAAVAAGAIHSQRYQHYLTFLEEIRKL